jgi:hypothetical protein
MKFSVEYAYETTSTPAADNTVFTDGTLNYKPTDYGTTINDIMSYVIPVNTEDIYGCGYAWLNPANFVDDMDPKQKENTGTIASFFGMDANGGIDFVFQLGEDTSFQSSICKSISHDSKTNDLMAVI